MTTLRVGEAYRRWAPRYDAENAVSFIEDRLARSLTPPLAGKALLDAGCGTGRRLIGAGAAYAVGVEPCGAMLQAGIGLGEVGPGCFTVLGDVRALPVADDHFDVIWCRLVLGHLLDPAPAYDELARVAKRSATVLVTDFHPAAYKAGHRRTFRDAEGVHEVEHYVHGRDRHVRAARQAGLILRAQHDGTIDRSVFSFYAEANRAALWADHLGLRVVQALAFVAD